MRFNQVIRAEPGAGECGPGVPEYQTGLGAGLSKWKSHLQLSWGPGQPGPGGALPCTPPWNRSAVTGVWCVHLGNVCRSPPPPHPHTGPGDGDQNGRGGSNPKTDLPEATSSWPPPLPELLLGAHLGPATQHPQGRPCTPPNIPLLSPHTSHATSPEPQPGDSGAL